MPNLLSIYNAGLRAVGEETLVDLTEATEAKVHLDQIWEYGALDNCLKLARPDFARRTVKLTGTASNHPAHDFEFELPEDHLAIMRDDTGQSAIFADVDTLYIRYVASIEDIDLYSPEFLEVLAAYLGMQLAPRIAPDMVEQLDARLKYAMETTRALGSEQWPSDRPTKSQESLSQDWLTIYRDTTQILGMNPLSGPDDQTELRIQLDIARQSGAIDALLDDTGWGFARCTVRCEPRRDLEPRWGYKNVFDKPDDCLRIRGLFEDEYLRSGMRDYQEEGNCFFANYDVLYLEYVPSTLKDTPSAWPPHFRSFVAAELAYRVKGVQRLNVPPAQQAMVMEEHERRGCLSRNTDAMQNPPRVIREGSWVKARLGYGRNYFSRRGGGSGRY